MVTRQDFVHRLTSKNYLTRLFHLLLGVTALIVLTKQ